MTALTLFPARIRFVNQDGTLTPEAVRMLELLVNRLGGAMGDLGADTFATDDPVDAAAAVETVVQPVDAVSTLLEALMQPAAAEPVAPEMVMQPPAITADQVDGLGTMATQNVGLTYSGSLTNKTVAVVNGIITSVT